MTNDLKTYDLVVMGGGPAGVTAATVASSFGKSVALVDSHQEIGGAGINTGTVPSKTLRETALALSGLKSRNLYGVDLSLRREVTVADFLGHEEHVKDAFHAGITQRLQVLQATIYCGTSTFLDAQTIQVNLGSEDREKDPSAPGGKIQLRCEKILIATGSSPVHPDVFPFGHGEIYDSDTILKLDRIPKTLAVVGAGVIGVEYASMFAALGTKVTIVEKRDAMLEFCDPEIVEALRFHLRDLAVTFRFGEEVTAVQVGAQGTVTSLASGKKIPAETVMYSAGRQGQTEHLNLDNAGLEADSRGRIFVDEEFRTKVDHIFAVGDVIGFPALASTSMDQGRVAACHAFGEPVHAMTALQPIGIYSIPEISYLGATEVELTKDAIPYEVGVARYRELARGQIAGDSYGMLKLLVSTEDLKLLGVHIFGSNATEMVHIGQAVMGCEGTVEFLVDAVFNYPTFSEAYKVAALDVMNKVRALNQFGS